MAAQHLTRSGQLKDVYSGGRQSSALEEKIERALTQRDEFGNIMTPKERFRHLCYGCAAFPLHLIRVLDLTEIGDLLVLPC